MEAKSGSVFDQRTELGASASRPQIRARITPPTMIRAVLVIGCLVVAVAGGQGCSFFRESGTRVGEEGLQLLQFSYNGQMKTADVHCYLKTLTKRGEQIIDVQRRPSLQVCKDFCQEIGCDYLEWSEAEGRGRLYRITDKSKTESAGTQELYTRFCSEMEDEGDRAVDMFAQALKAKCERNPESCRSSPAAVAAARKSKAAKTSALSQLSSPGQAEELVRTNLEAKAAFFDLAGVQMPEATDDGTMGGDTILSRHAARAIRAHLTDLASRKDSGHRVKRSSILDKDIHASWPSNDIKYRLQEDLCATSEQRSMVGKALAHIRDATCLHFTEVDRSYLGNDVITYSQTKDPTVCGWGMVGYSSSDPNFVQVSPECLKTIGTIVHETLHNLGMQHEHQRSDASKYITIVTNNVATEYIPSLAPLEVGTWKNMSEYDYMSIMHYHAWAFATDDRTYTINTADPEYQELIGQRDGLSERDIQGLNKAFCQQSEEKVDCAWRSWSEWSACSVPCNGPKQTRQRDQSPARNGGQDCQGSKQDSRHCQLSGCEKDCVWSEWSDWSDCFCYSNYGYKLRQRATHTPDECGDDDYYEYGYCTLPGCGDAGNTAADTLTQKSESSSKSSSKEVTTTTTDTTPGTTGTKTVTETTTRPTTEKATNYANTTTLAQRLGGQSTLPTGATTAVLSIPTTATNNRNNWWSSAIQERYPSPAAL